MLERRMSPGCGDRRLLQSHHVRAMAEELSQERGHLPASSDKSDHDLSLLARKAEIRRELYENNGIGQTIFDNK